MKRMTLVTRSGDSRCFKCGSCPSCPPGLRPEGFLTTGLGAPGGFAEGGNDELEAFSPNRARSSRTSALSSAICRTKSAIMASRSTHPGQDRGSMTTAYKINPSSAAPVFQLSRMNGYLFCFQRCLGGGETGDRHAIGGAADVVQADLVAELDAVRFAAVFTADSDLQIVARPPAFFDADPHQAADAVEVDDLEWVLRQKFRLRHFFALVVLQLRRVQVDLDEAAVVVAAHAKSSL